MKETNSSMSLPGSSKQNIQTRMYKFQVRAQSVSRPSNSNVSKLNVPEIKHLQALASALVTSNFDDDSNKTR